MFSKVKPKVYGTGLIALDFIMSANPSVPIHSWAGGTCGNVLTILSFLGWSAYPISRMNGDPASERVKIDLRKWGVFLDYINCAPSVTPPIIIQEIRLGKNGLPSHKFSWTCPHCGSWLPSFKPITHKAADLVAPHIVDPCVFFMDRLSRGALVLAKKVASLGGIVVFEPSSKCDPQLLKEALQVTHILKYAEQRQKHLDSKIINESSILLEICTVGEEGLHWRHRLTGKLSSWNVMPAIPAPVIADTCGAGDWCSAGLIFKLCVHGQEGLFKLGAEGIENGLRYGQALATWNCGFEGARGGMYVVSRTEFNKAVAGILEGKGHIANPRRDKSQGVSLSSFCPSCFLSG